MKKQNDVTDEVASTRSIQIIHRYPWSVRGIRVETSDWLSGLLAMSNNIFFGNQVKFFVLRGGDEKPRAHDVIVCSTNPM